VELQQTRRYRTSHLTGAEIHALHKGIQRSLFARNLLSGIGYPNGEPVVTYEDNQVTIQAVLADRTMPRLRHVDVLITSLHEWHLMQHFALSYTKSELMIADANTKPQAGRTTSDTSTSPMESDSSYPPPDSDHYKLAGFDKFNPN